MNCRFMIEVSLELDLVTIISMKMKNTQNLKTLSRQFGGKPLLLTVHYKLPAGNGLPVRQVSLVS